MVVVGVSVDVAGTVARGASTGSGCLVRVATTSGSNPGVADGDWTGATVDVGAGVGGANDRGEGVGGITTSAPSEQPVAADVLREATLGSLADATTSVEIH